MNQLFEFFLCPQHGILRTDNWPMIAASWQGLVMQAQLTWMWIRYRIMDLKPVKGAYNGH